MDEDQGDSLTYQITVVDSRNRPVIKPEWLTIDTNQLVVQGVPSVSSFKKKLRLRISASDEIFSNEQLLVMPIEFSLELFLYIATQVVGPLTGIIALIKFRGLLYSLFCKRRYQIRHQFEYAQGQEFYMTIPFIKRDLEETKSMFKQFKKQIGRLRKSCHAPHKSRRSWIFFYYNHMERQINLQLLREDFIKFLRWQQSAPADSHPSPYATAQQKESAKEERSHNNSTA